MLPTALRSVVSRCTAASEDSLLSPATTGERAGSRNSPPACRITGLPRPAGPTCCCSTAVTAGHLRNHRKFPKMKGYSVARAMNVRRFARQAAWLDGAVCVFRR